MKTQCPNCKAKFNTNDASVGKQAKCPKCAKPFTIEPFIETPVAVEPPVKSPEPVAPPAKKPESVAPPVKIAEPIAPPAPSPEPIAPQIKSPMPIAPPVKSPPLARPRPLAGPAPIAPQIKSPSPIAPPAITAQPIKEMSPEPKAVSKSASGPASPTARAEAGETSPQNGGAALSKMLFVYCWTGVRIIAGILGALGLMLAVQKGEKSTLIAVFAAADIFLICSVAIEYLLFYKMWAAIRDSQTSITPAKAVGFLFIPVFNIYWALLMVTGFAEDYNSFILRRAIKARSLPISLYLIYAFAFMLSETVLTMPMMCIFAFLGLISRAFDGYPAAFWALLAFLSASGIAHFITYILFAFKTCNAINALPERQSR
jgi:predicted Zn finger-like uncharacterized protein